MSLFGGTVTTDHLTSLRAELEELACRIHDGDFRQEIVSQFACAVSELMAELDGCGWWPDGTEGMPDKIEQD